MEKKRGRPKAARPLSDYLEIRVQPAEKSAFRDAADLSGIPLATWSRQRLRQAAIRELQDAGRTIAFLEQAPPTSEQGD